MRQPSPRQGAPSHGPGTVDGGAAISASAVRCNMPLLRCALLVAVLLVGAGCADDVVDGPFDSDWRLDEVPCPSAPEATRQCFELALTVRGAEGVAEATCRVFAADDAGLPVTPGTPVTELESFSIQAGDTPVFRIEVPAVDDESFSRWQVECDPGAPG